MRRPCLAVALLILGGCGATSPPARSGDFPLHAAQPPLFTLHWRLDRGDGTVTATGVAALSTPDRLEGAVIALEGLDREGRVSSRGTTRIQPRTFAGDVAWPFEVRLRTQGGEERYVVRVAEVTWRLTRGGR